MKCLLADPHVLRTLVHWGMGTAQNMARVRRLSNPMNSLGGIHYLTSTSPVLPYCSGPCP